MRDAGAGPIGVGLVGYGLAGSFLHAPLIGAEPRLRLHAVASRHPEKVHRDDPAVRVVATPAALLEDPAVELVVVAAPNELHHQLAGGALRAGRHVVVDKPFVTSLSEADELIRLAEREDRLLSVFHNRRWDGDYLTVRHCVRPACSGTSPSTSPATTGSPRTRPAAGGSGKSSGPASCTTSAPI